MSKRIFSFENALLLFFLLILGGLGTLWNIAHRNKEIHELSFFWIRHTQSVMEQALQVAALSKDLQLASGSYIIVDDTSALYDYQFTKRLLERSVLSLGALTVKNRVQLLRIQQLKNRLHQLILFSDRSVQLKKGGGFTRKSLEEFIQQRKVFGSMVTLEIDSIQREEMSLLCERQTIHSENLAIAYRFFVLSLLLTCILTGGAFLLTLYHFRKRRKAEKLMQESEARFQLLVNNIRDLAIYLIDAQGKILNWYQGAADVKGYSKEEIIGHSIALFYLPEDVEKGELTRNLHMARKMGRFETEGWRVHKDGSRFWADVLITAIYHEDRMLQGFTVVARDFTQHRKAKEESQLALQKEKELSEMKSNFITHASHQFRTPLSAILSSVALMEQYRSTDEVQEKRDRHLSQIRTSVKEITCILQSFLSYEYPGEEKANSS
jgi:PAS domain S-box-containing protein